MVSPPHVNFHALLYCQSIILLLLYLLHLKDVLPLPLEKRGKSDNLIEIMFIFQPTAKMTGILKVKYSQKTSATHDIFTKRGIGSRSLLTNWFIFSEEANEIYTVIIHISDY